VASQSSTYDVNDRLTSDNYDNNGNTTTASGNSYAYDFDNRLTSLNAGNATYVYDGDGNRVAKTVGGVTTNYLVDTNNPTGYAQVVDELQSGAVVKSFTYGHDLISQRIVGGSLSFYQYDGHSSVTLLTDAGGSITDTYDYDAFGNLLFRTGSTPNDYLYSGEQMDANLGFYYLRARYMNPSSGRFWTMDSFEGGHSDPRSLHKYLYGNADPVNNVDPSGNSSIGEISTSLAIASVLSAVSTIALNLLTASTAVSTAQENFSLDGLLISGRLSASGFGGTVGAGLDVVVDFKRHQVWVALASEFGTAPVSIFKTQRGTGGSLMAGFVIAMNHPSELSGRGVGASQPLALWRLQGGLLFGAGENKAWSLLMHLAKRSNNSIGWSGLVGVSNSGPAYFQVGKGISFSSTVTENGAFVPLSEVPENVRDYASALAGIASSLANVAHDPVSLSQNADSFLSQIQGFSY
jgi:RHS repeat-associated protein